MSKTVIEYRTFDELLAEASTDLSVYSAEGMIEPGQLIKVAQQINFRLGLKLHQTQEVILDVEDGRAKLPDDFHVLNYSLLCLHEYSQTESVIQGDQREDVDPNTTIADLCADDLAVYSCKGTFINAGKEFAIVEKRKFTTRVYKRFHPIKVKPGTLVSKECAGSNQHSPLIIELKGKHVHCSFSSGKLYLNYQGKLQDADGNLLVVDHPLLNEYYEYAIKERILENLYLNGEDVTRKLELVQAKLRAARVEAMSYVNTPDFAELKQIWEMNRKAMYHKYYRAFQS